MCQQEQPGPLDKAVGCDSQRMLWCRYGVPWRLCLHVPINGTVLRVGEPQWGSRVFEKCLEVNSSVCIHQSLL